MKINVKYFFITIILSGTLQVSSQKTKSDSLKFYLVTAKADTNKANALLKLGHIMAMSSDKNIYNGCVPYYEEALALSEKLNFKPGQILALGELGAQVEARKSDFRLALNYYYKSCAVAEEFGNSTLTFERYGQVLNACFYLGDYPKAMETAVKGLKLAEKENNKIMIANYYNLFGFIYSNQNNKQKTKEYLEKYLNAAKEIGNESMLGHAYAGMANVSEEEKNYKMAIQYLFSSLNIYENICKRDSNDIGKTAAAQQQITSLYNSIASIYKILGEDQLALNYSLKCLQLAYKVGVNKYELANYYITNGGLHTRLKEFTKAEEAIKTGLRIADSIKHKENIKMAYYEFSLLYFATNNFKKAYEFQKQYSELKGLLLNEKNLKQMTEMNTKYESEKKDKELIKKDAEINQQQLEAKQQSTLRNAFIVGFVLVLLLALFVLRSYRHTQKANQAISEQKEIIENKNKEITDSIHYAKRIQKALLASDSLLQNNLPGCFVLYKPKDIVSGDFYWANLVNDKFLLCVADCTGHGVPGAFMSLLNISFLNEITIEKKIIQTDLILNNVRSSIINSLNTEGNEESKDGMDCVLCSFDLKNKRLEYSAANNSFCIIRNNEIIFSLVDKMPVGKSPKENSMFVKHTFDLEKNDTLYIFTDGYADQFGGPKGKKFKYKQLEEILLVNHKRSMDEQKTILNQTIESWKGKLEQVDDILILGIKI